MNTLRFRSSARCRLCRYLVVVGALCALLATPARVMAWTCDKIGAQYETLNMPASIVVPRDVGNNTPLTGWYYTAQVTSRYCTTSGGTASLGVGVSYQTNGLTPVSGVTITNESGNPAQVYYTNLAGVGIAFQAYGWQCGGYSPWGNVLNYNSIWWGCANSTTAPWSNWLAGRLAARLVKIGNVSAGRIALSRPVKQIAIIDSQWDWGGDNTRRWFDFTGTDVVVGSCVTPDVTVDLGKLNMGALTGVGSTGPAVAFNLSINNCPAGISGIWYGFNYPSADLRGDGPNGIINAGAGSTAAGVAVQMLDSNNAPVAMDTWFGLPGYNTSGGNYTVPLKARFIQRAATVTPGTVTTYILIAMHYH